MILKTFDGNLPFDKTDYTNPIFQIKNNAFFVNTITYIKIKITNGGNHVKTNRSKTHIFTNHNKISKIFLIASNTFKFLTFKIFNHPKIMFCHSQNSWQLPRFLTRLFLNKPRILNRFSSPETKKKINTKNIKTNVAIVMMDTIF